MGRPGDPTLFSLAPLRCCLSLVLLSSALFPSFASAQAPGGADGIGEREGLPVVTWQDAEKMEGRKVVVTGKVVRIGHRPTIHFINFTQERNQFTAVVFEDNIGKFDKTLEELYEGNLVEIVGVVTRYQQTPQIVVSSPDQIRVVEQLTKPFVPQFADVTVGDELTIATYNIRNLFDDVDQPYRDDEGTNPKPREEMVRVAATIRAINADILALQEVETRGYLRKYLDVFVPEMGYKHVVHFEGNDGRGIDVCLVSRVPIGRVISHRHLSFKGPDGVVRRFNRDILRVEILPQGGDPFEMWVVHLKSNYGGREAAEPIRLAEAVELRKLVDLRLAANPAADFLICGDFNDSAESATLQTIVGSEGNPALLVSFYESIPAAQRITYNREPYREMIDFILCSPGMAARFIEGSYRIEDGTLEQSGSDHNPVIARFSAKK